MPVVATVVRRLRSTFPRRVLAGLVAAGIVLAVGAVTISRHPADFVSGTTLVFLRSQSVQELQAQTGETVEPASQSPFARDDPDVTAEMFADLYNGQAKRRALAEAGFVGTLDATSVRGANGFILLYGPALTVTVRAPSPVVAQNDVALVVADVRAELDARQAAFDPRLSVRVVELARPSEAVFSTGSRKRAVMGFAGLALIAGLVTPPLLELVRRRGRSTSHPNSVPADGPQGDGSGHVTSVAERSSAAVSAGT